MLAVLALTFGILGLAPAAPSYAAGCGSSTGVSVVVQYGSSTSVGCATGSYATALDAVHAAGFTTQRAAREFSGYFICKVNGQPASDPCQRAPTGSYWSVWSGKPGQGWSYAQTGIATLAAPQGTSIGLRYGNGAAPVTAPIAPAPKPTPKPTPKPSPTTTSKPSSSSTSKPSSTTSGKATSSATSKSATATSASKGSSTSSSRASSSSSVKPPAGSSSNAAAASSTSSGGKSTNVAAAPAQDAGSGGGGTNLGLIVGGGSVALLGAGAAVVAMRRREQ